MKNYISYLIALATALQVVGCQPKPTPQGLERIAFGSCSRQEIQDQMWDEIVATDPELWIWLGDNIYGDTEDMELMKSKYDMQKNRPGYQKLRAAVPIIGTWDDHDFGVNDGGKEYPMRVESQRLLLDFLDVPQDAPVRQQAGVYQVFEYGEAERKVKVILLDTRYHRDSLTTDTTGVFRYVPDQGAGDMLGEAQWQWLEDQLTNSDARIHVIGTSIQVIPTEQGYEKWANLPAARQRLFDLLVKTQARGVIFISGDRHIAEISKIELAGLDYPIYDFTASGLTHTWGRPVQEPNRFRVDTMVHKKNYGLLDFAWEEEYVEVTMIAKGKGDSVWLKHSVRY